jgi:hypothetical protein
LSSTASPGDVLDGLVDGGAQRDGAVLGEVLLGRQHRLRHTGVVDTAQHERRDGGERQQQRREDRDWRADASDQRHVGSTAGSVLPRRGR